MIEIWILFVCGVNVDTMAVKCHSATAPTEQICMVERDRILALQVPLAATCFPLEREGEPESMGT